jgi:hypothetical protein
MSKPVPPGDYYLKRENWKQEGDRGEIFMDQSKTDIFGRGHLSIGDGF